MYPGSERHSRADCSSDGVIRLSGHSALAGEVACELFARALCSPWFAPRRWWASASPAAATTHLQVLWPSLHRNNFVHMQKVVKHTRGVHDRADVLHLQSSAEDKRKTRQVCARMPKAFSTTRRARERRYFNPRTCRGVGWTPHGFTQITRVKRGGSPRNLQYPRVDQFDTYCENFKSMSCQVIKL